jgi:hypothetical protein
MNLQRQSGIFWIDPRMSLNLHSHVLMCAETEEATSRKVLVMAWITGVYFPTSAGTFFPSPVHRKQSVDHPLFE